MLLEAADSSGAESVFTGYTCTHCIRDRKQELLDSQADMVNTEAHSKSRNAGTKILANEESQSATMGLFDIWDGTTGSVDW